MQYIHLSNDSYILKTSQGMHTLNRDSFNFNKIKRLLSNCAEEDKIIPLLKTPKLPDGMYKAYVVPEEHAMYYVHVTKDESGVNFKSCDIAGNETPFVTANANFVGVYASKEDLILDWPEYTI